MVPNTNETKHPHSGVINNDNTNNIFNWNQWAPPARNDSVRPLTWSSTSIVNNNHQLIETIYGEFKGDLTNYINHLQSQDNKPIKSHYWDFRKLWRPFLEFGNRINKIEYGAHPCDEPVMSWRLAGKAGHENIIRFSYPLSWSEKIYTFSDNVTHTSEGVAGMRLLDHKEGCHPATSAANNSWQSWRHECAYNGLPLATSFTESLASQLRPHHSDGQPVLTTTNFYRMGEKHFGSRCGLHGAHNLHRLTDEFLQSLADTTKVSKEFLDFITPTLDVVLRLFDTFEDQDIINITATDNQYEAVCQTGLTSLATKHVLFVNEDFNLPSHLDIESVKVVRVKSYVSNRSLAMFRLLPVFFVKRPLKMLVTNRDAVHLGVDFMECFNEISEPFYNVVPCTYLPAAAGVMVATGGHLRGQLGYLIAFELGGFIYGTDEASLLMTGQMVAVYHLNATQRVNGIAGISANVWGPWDFTAIIIGLGRKVAYQYHGFNRRTVVDIITNENLMAGHLIKVSPSLRQVFMHRKARPLNPFKVLTKQQYKNWVPHIKPLAERMNGSLSDCLGPIVFFTVGTRGDQVPIEALGKVLSNWSLEVIVVHLTSLEEGERLLKAAEEGVALNHIDEMSDFVAIIRNCPFICFAPAFLKAFNALSYSCSPPDELVRPMDPGINAWLALVFKVLDIVKPPDFYIGAYANRTWWLPRSHDGTNFLSAKTNRGTKPVGLVVGSSSVPVPAEFKDVERVPLGDHNEIMRDYIRIITPGSAGAVQTAACCGCKVYAYTTVMDRNYLHPSEPAGVVAPGASPDLIFLVLAKAQPMLVLTFMLHKPFQSFKALRWFVIPYVMIFTWNLMGLYMASNLSGQGRLLGPDLLTYSVAILMPEMLGVNGRILMAFLLVVIVKLMCRELGVTIPVIVMPIVRHFWASVTSKLFWLMLATTGHTGALILTPWVQDFVSLVVDYSLRGGIILTGSNPDGGDNQSYNSNVYLSFRLFWNGPLPLIHTALVDMASSEVWEGSFDGEVGPGAPFSTSIRRWDGLEPNTIYLPTSISRKQFECLPAVTGRYGMFWNCQSAVLISIKSLGLDVGYAAAALLVTVTSASLFMSIMAVVILAILVFLVSLPSHLGGKEPADLIPEIGWLYRGLDSLHLGSAFGSLFWVRKLREYMVVTHTSFGNRDTEALDLAESKAQAQYLVDQTRERIGRFRELPEDHEGLRVIAPVEIQTQIHEINVQIRILSERFTFELAQTENYSHYVEVVKKDLERTLGSAASALWGHLTDKARSDNDFFKYDKDAEFNAFTSEVETNWSDLRWGDPDFKLWLESRLVDLEDILDDTQIEQLRQRYTPLDLRSLLMRGLSGDVRAELSKIQGLPDIQPLLEEFAPWLNSERGRIRKSISVRETQIWARVAMRRLTVYSRDLVHAGRAGRLLTGQEQFDRLLTVWGNERKGYPYVGENKGRATELLMEFAPVLSKRDFELAIVLLVDPDQDPQWFDHVSDPFRDQDDHDSDRMNEDQNELLKTISASRALMLKLGYSEESTLEAALQAFGEGLQELESRHTARSAKFKYAGAMFDEYRSDDDPGPLEHFQEIISQAHALLASNETTGVILNAFMTVAIHIHEGVNAAVITALNSAMNILDEMTELIGEDVAVKVAQLLGNSLRFLGMTPREHGKVVWAPLFMETRQPISASERLLASLRGMPQDMTRKPEALKDTIDLLRRHFPKDRPMPELLQKYVRPIYKPRKAYGTSQEFVGVINPPELIVDGVLEERVQNYLAEGAPQGLDGIYAYDDEKGMSSLSRYEPPPMAVDPVVSSKVKEAADAMISQNPELYLDMKMTTPETVAAYIQKKYSPGIPFIGTYRSRKELFNTGWSDAIISATRECLATGNYPEQFYHAFPKMQVVNKEKLLSGKPIRTVVAQDLLTSFIDHTLMLERAKRPAISSSGIAMGQKLNEPGLLTFFEKVYERRMFFKADAEEYDASIPPVAFEGLAYLAEKGYEGSHGGRAAADMVKKHYMRMYNSTVVLLSNGAWVEKNRGGATGQSCTSWDGTHSFRLMAISVWSFITGKPCSEFFKSNWLGNQTDDNLWGSDDDLTPTQIADGFKLLFGVKVIIESANNKDDLGFLGKKRIPATSVSEDYESLGLPVPENAIVSDLGNLLMRRSAFTSLLGGKPFVEHYRGRVMRTVGHLLLTGHQRCMYDRLATEWMQDAKVLLRCELGCKPFDIVVDAEGNIVEVEITKSFKAASRNQANVLAFLRKSGRAPTYREVLVAHLKPDDLGRLEYRSNKLKKLAPKISALEWSHQMLQNFREFMNSACPPWLTHLHAESENKPLEFAFTIKDFMMESYIYRMFSIKNKADPSLNEFVSVCKESPYRNTLDPQGFMWWKDIPRNRKKLKRLTLEELSNYCYTVTANYVIVNLVVERLKKVPILGRVLEIFTLTNVELPKLYSSLNLLYWHSTARSSNVISGLMPGDPYLNHKRLARLLTVSIPKPLFKVILSRYVNWFMPWLTETISSLQTMDFMRSVVAKSLNTTFGDNPWNMVAQDLVKAMEEGNPYHYLKAATSTGKSTWLLAAILALRPTWHIWLVVPRIINRTEYKNPFISEKVIKLERGSERTDERLIVSTYGQCIARVDRWDFTNCLLILDEIHEGTAEMIALELHTRHFRRLAITATPRTDLYPTLTSLYVAPIERRFETTIIRMEGSTLSLYAEAANKHPELAKRALIVCPSISGAHAIADSLNRSGVEASVLTKHCRTVARSGVIVATQIVDSGLNIDPPVNLGIDSGHEVVSDKGKVTTQWSSPQTLTQRSGRVGRAANGFFYTVPRAGTGPEPTLYPTWNLFCSKTLVRDHFVNCYGLNIVLESPGPGYRVGVGLDPTILRSNLIPATDVGQIVRFQVSLGLYYIMVGTTSDHMICIDAYNNLIERNLYHESLSSIEEVIAAKVQIARPLEYNMIETILHGLPFETKLNGVPIRHAGLKLESFTAKPLGWQSQRR